MRTLGSKKFIFIGVVLTVLAILFFGEEVYSQKQPNIIFISIDTLRADHLSCYGYSRKTSPNIDKFSKDAVLFENAISQASTTAPAHMSLFTATTPAVHGVRNFNKDRADDKSLNKNISTFAEVLSQKKYMTVGFHDGGNIVGILGFDRGFDLYSSDFISWRKVYDNPEELNDIRAWIKSSKEKDRPLFLFLHHYMCHDPYGKSPEKFRLRFLDEKVEGLPIGPDYTVQNKSFLHFRESFWKDVDLSDLKHKNHIISLYDGGVYYSDYIFKEVMKILKEEEYYDNSIIILLSDHGEEFYEHGDNLHWRLFIETLHVPLIIKFPYGEYRGKRIKERVRTFDLMPTLFQFLGIKADNLMQGVSFQPLLTKKGTYTPLIMSFCENMKVRFIHNGFVYSNQPGDDCQEWLFDANSDPGEQNNLIDYKADVLIQMRSMSEVIAEQQEEFLQRLENYSDGGKSGKINEELLEQLKALGYAQ